MKKGLTQKQYLQIGRQLKKIKKQLVAIHTNIGEGTAAKAKRKQLFKADDGLEALRCHLENVMFMDYPESTTEVFHGSTED